MMPDGYGGFAFSDYIIQLLSDDIYLSTLKSDCSVLKLRYCKGGRPPKEGEKFFHLRVLK
jgi:hypothetical protein